MFTLVGCVVALWSTTHTSGSGPAASVLNTQQRFVYMQRCRGSYTCYTTEIIKHCYTAKITRVFPGRRLTHSCVTALCVSTSWPLVFNKFSY